MGGDNSKENLILLTFREHWLGHYLLSKFVENPSHKSKLLLALHLMSSRSKSPITFFGSRFYQYLRETRYTHKGFAVTDETLQKMRDSARARGPNVEWTPELREKQSRIRKQFIEDNPQHKEEMIERLREANQGVVRSEEFKKKVSESMKGRSSYIKGKKAFWNKVSGETKMFTLEEVDLLDSEWVKGYPPNRPGGRKKNY